MECDSTASGGATDIAVYKADTSPWAEPVRCGNPAMKEYTSSDQ